ncbi:MAG: Isoleucyl-tRNA synthetase, isoleucyl-tRNA synthetase, partial [Candidatus Paceibacter sp.]|nr:Isoleucyl-tRNA synthetase, isoleucyl-tRNA synthetase [Candidatus Paceibacter sp.]
MADETKKNPQEKSAIAEREEKILKFWQENEIFQKSLEKDSPKGEFVFYDGPPFATGLPHYGHLIGGTMKDIVPRFKTMQGYHVPRRWGWDTHGLPIENLIEKELGLKSKKDIEELGVEKFNEAAKAAVLRYDKEWKEIIPRTGRWVDMDNAYLTMQPTYSESIWWSFKTLYDKKLIYNGFKSMMLCPHCGTTLSNFEVAQGYKDVTDISVYVKFELVDEPGTFVVAWTTTPWTLPGNVALAVGADIDYVKVKIEKEFFILAKDRLSVLKEKQYEIVEEMKGSALVGKKYTPVFDYYVHATLENKQHAWKIVAADFVTTTDGTGVVHIAPAFGEDDYNLSLKEQLPFIQHVAVDGAFKKEVKDFAGQQVKPKSDVEKDRIAADIAILKYLQDHGTFFAKEKITHAYPHCWRCDTPLLNYATSSWFVKVTDIKDKLVAENNKVNWVPPEIGEGRFGKWLENARDWAISRSRYWGAPLPVWICTECGRVEVIGSVADIKAHTKRNDYFVIRHGEADHNVNDILSSDPKNPHHLTDHGLEQVTLTAQALRNKHIDLIVASPFVRTRETVDVLVEQLAYKGPIEFDTRLGEFDFGDFNLKNFEVYHEYFETV